MTIYNKSTLKTFFETGDVPDGGDYSNLIDSCLNLAETSAQSMAGAIAPTEVITPRVSATNANFTGIVSAATLTVNSVSAGSIITSTVSAASVYATNIIAQAGSISSPVTIAASGTTLGTANLLTTARITLLTAATDGSATGIGLLANQSGLQQYVYNDTSVSANLWPCTGGQINNLSSGAAFGMTAKTLYTIVHTKASGYAVK